MEFFILDSIAEHLKQQNLIVDSQHGVKPSGSNLVMFLEEVTSC